MEVVLGLDDGERARVSGRIAARFFGISLNILVDSLNEGVFQPFFDGERAPRFSSFKL